MDPQGHLGGEQGRAAAEGSEFWRLQVILSVFHPGGDTGHPQSPAGDRTSLAQPTGLKVQNWLGLVPNEKCRASCSKFIKNYKTATAEH